MQFQTYRERITLLVLCAYFVSLPSALAGTTTLPPLFSPEGGANVREYYTTNKENRFLLKIHVWGDVSLSGIHHVPDNSTLLDLIGYAGGPAGGGFGDATITLSRKVAGKDQPTEIALDGFSIVRKNEFRNMRLYNDDVIYLQTPKPDKFITTLTLIGTILGIISTSATLYLLFTR